MSERRYSEAEVAAIFERAAEAPQTGARHASSSSSSGEGMTLAMLQEIGREVGIPAEAIASAARTVDQGERGPTASRRLLGLPVGVERVVQLDRKLSEDEWEQLVVVLRETFDARGTMRSQGSLREWTNGNLQALLEPTATGHRVRLRTFKGDAPGLLLGGTAMLGFSVVALAAAAAQGALGDAGFLAAVGALAVAGASMFGAVALRLPRWARTRRQQMDDVAARLASAAPPQLPPSSE